MCDVRSDLEVHALGILVDNADLPTTQINRGEGRATTEHTHAADGDDSAGLTGSRKCGLRDPGRQVTETGLLRDRGTRGAGAGGNCTGMLLPVTES